ncbi:MAG: putative lipopolysaccharide heptosyltransferase III [Burkholderiaceae bacterium]
MTRPIPPRRVLIVSLRFLGDALLSTPLAAAVKRDWPGCTVDMLVFKGCDGMLEGNPDIDRVLTVPQRPGKGEQLQQLRSLWNRYDLTFITQTGTRPFLYGWAAGRMSVAPVSAERGKSWWKQALLSRHLRWNLDAPRFLENEQLLSLVGLRNAPPPCPPSAGLDRAGLARLTGAKLKQPYAVIHPSPRWQYKRWTNQGWRELIQALLDHGLGVVLTGGPGEAEREYLESVRGELRHEALWPVPGRLSLAQSADLIRHATLFVGVDTATTHIAAATGTPTVALFGPTDPTVWGPWPATSGAAYTRSAPSQQRGNVLLIQNPHHACQPCQKEGCDRHVNSRSACLDDLEATVVIRRAEQLLFSQTDNELANKPAQRELHT